MIMNYRRITPEELEGLRAEAESDPEAVMRFLYGDDETDFALTAQLEREGRTLDIDKSWHAIHFLLTGSAWEGEAPLANAVLGGTELGEDVIGYGPTRYLTPDEVREVADALGTISSDDLMQRATPQAIAVADIYSYSAEHPEDEREYITENYDLLVRFFRGASEAGEAMLLYMN